MGNSASHVTSSDVESSSFSLDVLGGWNRPPIKRGDSLNKKLEWLQNAVRKQANFMEHELLKMPEAKRETEPRTSVAEQRQSRDIEDNKIRRPAWDGTFWGHSNSAKRRAFAQLLSEAKEQGVKLPLRSSSFQSSRDDETSQTSLHEKQYERPWRQDSLTRKRSWHQKLRDKLQNRLKILREEETDTIVNYDGENESEAQQVPLWRLNVARAKVKILIYVRALMLSLRENKDQELVLRENSLLAYAMVALGPAFSGFCQQQLLHSQLAIESPKSATSSTSDSTPEHSSEQISTIEEEDLQQRLTEEHQSEHKIELKDQAFEESKEKALLLMQMHVNRANAKWVEAQSWTDPHIYDPAALVMGRADIKIYKHLLLEMLSEGKVALQLIDSGIKAETSSENSAKGHQSVLSFDPWEKIAAEFPWKVSDRGRLEGLSILSRRLLQIVVDFQTLGGKPAVGKLKIILCVDIEQESYVRELLIQKNFFGLNRENVLIITIPRFQGMHYDKDDAEMKWSTNSSRYSAGTGWSMLALKASNGVAYRLDKETNEPCFLDTTPLAWLREREVTWINAQLIMDWEKFSPDTSIDVDFCATSLYCSDEKDANMAMQVMECASSKEIWNDMNLVLGNENNSRNCCAIKTTDLQTPLTRKLVMDAELNGSLISCQHRFMFKTKALEEMTIAPCILRPDIKLQKKDLYLSYSLSSITTVPGSRCAAVLTFSPGPKKKLEVLDLNWFHNAATRLTKQDSNPAFLTASLNCCSNRSPILLKSPKEIPHKNIVVAFIVENLVSRKTASLASFFVNENTDELHLVTSVAGEQHVAATMEFLESIQHSLIPSNCSILCKVLIRGQGRVMDMMEDYIHEVKAKLVVVGSENLSKENTEVIGSFAMTVVKTINYLPVLIVKINSTGECHKRHTVESLKGKNGVRCMIELRPNAQSLVQWTLGKLNGSRDLIYLAKPRGIDQTEKTTPVATRMLSTFHDKVESLGFSSLSRPLKGEPIGALNQAVCQDKIDVLAVQTNKSAAVPSAIANLLRTVKTSVLIFRNNESSSNLL